MTDTVPARPRRRRPDGPPAGVLAIVSLALTIASAVAHGMSSELWTGFFAFGASVPIGIYAATVHARLRRLGIRVPGPTIALFGGISASVLLAVAGLITWARSQSAAPLPAPVAGFVSDMTYAVGGVGVVGGLGLLIAGIAVPSVILRLTPRWLGWAGLVLAALGEVSYLALLWGGLDVLLPIVRFGGLAWLAVVGFLLPVDRHAVPRRDRQVPR